MDFFTVVNTRRSVRQFTAQPVPRADLEQIVAAAIEAPTGCNMQSKQYVIVDAPALLEKIRPMSGAMKTAPAIIVLLTDAKPTPYGEFWVQDASAAMQNMLLAAVALGYGACWVEGGVRAREDELREILGVPAHLRVWTLMPVGVPESAPQRPAKPSAADVTHYNRFSAR